MSVASLEERIKVLTQENHDLKTILDEQVIRTEQEHDAKKLLQDNVNQLSVKLNRSLQNEEMLQGELSEEIAQRLQTDKRLACLRRTFLKIVAKEFVRKRNNKRRLAIIFAKLHKYFEIMNGSEDLIAYRKIRHSRGQSDKPYTLEIKNHTVKPHVNTENRVKEMRKQMDISHLNSQLSIESIVSAALNPALEGTDTNHSLFNMKKRTQAVITGSQIVKRNPKQITGQLDNEIVSLSELGHHLEQLVLLLNSPMTDMLETLIHWRTTSDNFFQRTIEHFRD